MWQSSRIAAIIQVDGWPMVQDREAGSLASSGLLLGAGLRRSWNAGLPLP